MESTPFVYDAIIVGSGAAGLNAADSLYNLGVTNIAIITEALYSSTSINTGSDKQTYYKISTTGDEKDSVMDMARTYYSCGGIEGFHALTEASLSLRCFFKLVEYGVPFPQNAYGEYVGYRTDHDTRRRASSCGPLTSKFMCEALIKKVLEKKIEIIENKRVIELIKYQNRICGCVMLDISTGSLHSVAAKNIIYASGGPSGIYLDSVYPKCQTGGLAAPLLCGAAASSLCEWQYGIASTEFRWNLSGSYQQVIPRYVSLDDSGNLREFLPDYIDKNINDLVFQKGYNWPFTPKNLSGKSSLIDIAVYIESQIKKRKVFLDYRQNPVDYDVNNLCDETREYLENSGLCQLASPIERLKKLNIKAYQLYLSNGIDLEKVPLDISVCAQHCNGGLKVDENYMTTIENLYACGECAGVFGVTRPGGSALNSTQVSSLRAALCIAKKNVTFDTDAFTKQSSSILGKLNAFKKSLSEGNTSPMEIRHDFSAKMSKSGSFIRKRCDICALMDYAKKLLPEIFTATKATSPLNIYNAFVNRDLVITMLAVLESQLFYIDSGYTSRGGYIVLPDENADLLSFCSNVKTDSRDFDVVDTSLNSDGVFSSSIRTVSPIPQSEQWFEKVAFGD